MKKNTVEIVYDELTFDELPADQRELVDRAMAATDNSNAKYSGFHVGAAIRLADGRVMIGANQENAAFSLCICAERSAIFAAQVHYPDQSINAIAIAARNADGFVPSPVTPCGSCRQVMVEMEDRYKNNMTVLLCGKDKVFRLKSAKDLLPLGFVDDNMR